MKSALGSALLLSLAPPAVAAALRLGVRTLSIERDERAVAPLWQAHAPIIYAVWHSRVLLLPVLYGRRGVRVLASRSRDGELVTRCMTRFGCEAVRGSSSRGGAEALRLLARALKRGREVVIVPDGPTGPPERVKPGIVALARLSGAAIVPVAVGTSPEWRLGSWDGFRIPRPFGRCVARFGEPIYVPRTADRRDEDAARDEVERALAALGSSVDRDAR